jgi:hypothetical protein
MIVVTGTKRSGTSLWMQILKASGLTVLGSEFPSVWGESIRAANPNGFYESRLRKGIYFATNPDPRTGEFLPPAATRQHAVKVFVPGLVRSDLAYLDRVVASMRHWREYGPSLQRLYAMEDAWLAEQKSKTTADDPRWKTSRSDLPPAIEWWAQTYDLIRDYMTRRYPFHLVTYDHLLRDPDGVLKQVLPWVGATDVDAGIAVVDGGSRTQRARTGGDEGVLPDEAELFDTLYDHFDRGTPLPATLLAEMNRVQKQLQERHRPRATRDVDDPRDESSAT